MIHEFAVEPRLLATWERFRYITEKFDVSEGRLISQYPKKWVRMVYHSIDEKSEINKKRIEENLARINTKLMRRIHPSKYNDEDLDWLSNAIKEDSRYPFHAILALENPHSNERVLSYSELQENHPLWKVARAYVVPRIASNLATAVLPLLQLAETIIFVDPHFSPTKPRAVKTLKAFLEKLDLNHGSKRIEYHTKLTEDNPRFEEDCHERVSKCIPTGMSLKIIRWSEHDMPEGLHNRYILMERGGVSFHWGLDEGNPGETDDILLLDREVYTNRWNQYCGGARIDRAAKTFTVDGSYGVNATLDFKEPDFES